ncbi:MAG: helix-turn-helix domain-containing protein [Gemmatimonadaceae bacterium]
MPRYAPDRRVLGRVLRRLREEADLTQEKLGFRAKLHRNYVGSAERGERNVSFDSIERWLAALETSWKAFGQALDWEAERSAATHLRKVAESRRGYSRGAPPAEQRRR